VTLRAADVCASIAAGERVLTEISRKFTRVDTERMLSQGGMRMLEWIVDSDPANQSFALCLAGAISQVAPDAGKPHAT
jgi:uncharacterized SAM-dependent methyltransferase